MAFSRFELVREQAAQANLERKALQHYKRLLEDMHAHIELACQRGRHETREDVRLRAAAKVGHRALLTGAIHDFLQQYLPEYFAEESFTGKQTLHLAEFFSNGYIAATLALADTRQAMAAVLQNDLPAIKRRFPKNSFEQLQKLHQPKPEKIRPQKVRTPISKEIIQATLHAQETPGPAHAAMRMSAPALDRLPSIKIAAASLEEGLHRMEPTGSLELMFYQLMSDVIFNAKHLLESLDLPTTYLGNMHHPERDFPVYQEHALPLVQKVRNILHTLAPVCFEEGKTFTDEFYKLDTACSYFTRKFAALGLPVDPPEYIEEVQSLLTPKVYSSLTQPETTSREG